MEQLCRDVADHSIRFDWSDASKCDVMFCKISPDLRADIGMAASDTYETIVSKLRAQCLLYDDSRLDFRSFRLLLNEDLLTAFRRLLKILDALNISECPIKN